MNKSLRTLRSRMGLLWRDIYRQMEQVHQIARAGLQDLMARTKRIPGST